jgi:Ti-type conjugative transfer relaxase TraA
MAIAFARARYIGRSTGGVAVRSAAYNARVALTDERTGELFYFRNRDAPQHHEVLLPEGADQAFADSARLWNAAELAEKRRDAQVARELVIALPANLELSPQDRVALARSFAQEHFVSKGLAVQLDIHAPHAGEDAAETANHHAHLLITTRRLEGDHLAAKKARDLDPEVKRLGGRAAVTDGEAWGVLWRDHQNRYFAAQGLELRVDAIGAVPQEHVGPVRMRAADSEAVARAQEIARANAAAARDPDKVLSALTRKNASFTERELDRYLAKHIPAAAEHLAVKAKVLGHAESLALHDPRTGEAVGRYTTRTVRDQERAALADAERIAGAHRHRALHDGAKAQALATRGLRPDQAAAFDYATASGSLKIVEGRAGTGKSYTLNAVREAHQLAGYQVIGLAPTNSVAQDMKADGFAQASTVHSELFRLKNDRTHWTDRTLLIVDEAAMLDTPVMGELLAQARRAGAKVILAGDDRQLASIERGGLFAELRQRQGSVEITEVTRQKVDWQRQAARDLAEGRVAEAVTAFDREGAITWSSTQDQAMGRLVERWRADTAAAADGSRFVFAYTNQDVSALNAALRAVRRERGELGDDVAFQTKHGLAEFAVGDRVQFTDTLKSERIYNGNVGVITDIDANTGVIQAQLEGAKLADGVVQEVRWSAHAFDGFRHGYAGTIHKGQGKTLDHTYLYHSHHWRQAPSYVALTRQRESAHIFAATETAKDVGQLARQMSRSEVRRASVGWATWDELAPELRAEAVARSKQAATPSPAGRAPTDRPEHGWLIAPRASASSPTRAGEIAAAITHDPRVQRERDALDGYLAAAYRDPDLAKARLKAMVQADGPGRAAQSLVSDPTQLGELRGKVGLLAGRSQREARGQAERVAEAIGPAVARVGEADALAATAYVRQAQAKAQAQAGGVPRLSPTADAALSDVLKAKTPPEQVAAWTALRSDPALVQEVSRFMGAVEGRFGADGVRTLDRTGTLADAQLAAGERAALGEIGRQVRAAREGPRAARSIAQAAAQALGAGKALKL